MVGTYITYITYNPNKLAQLPLSVPLCSESRASTRPCPLKGNPAGGEQISLPGCWWGFAVGPQKPDWRNQCFITAAFSDGLLLLVLMLLLQILFAQFQGRLVAAQGLLRTAQGSWAPLSLRAKSRASFWGLVWFCVFNYALKLRGQIKLGQIESSMKPDKYQDGLVLGTAWL